MLETNIDAVCPLTEVPTPNAEMGWRCHVVWSTPNEGADQYLLLMRRPHDFFPNKEEWAVASWSPQIERGWYSAAYAMSQEEALEHGDKKCAVRGGGNRWVACGPVKDPHFIFTWRIWR